MPRAASSSRAGCMRSRSDSEPIRIPTRGDSGTGNVATIARAVERDPLDGGVGLCPGVAELLADAGDAEDPPAVRDQRASCACRPGVEDERAGGLRLVDPLDRRARVVPRRVAS